MESEELRSLPVDEVVAKVGVSRAIGIKYVASLLFTYRCTIACRHCLFNCSPQRPDVCVSFEDGVEFLRQLRETDRVIHIAGGEAIMYWDQMLAICKKADAGGFAPHFIETNASFAVDDETTLHRFESLRDAGVLGVLISADAFHQTFVPPERRFRAFEHAGAVFGRENVAAGDISLDDLKQLRAVGRDAEAMPEYARRYAPRLTGRAGDSLAQYFPLRPLDELANDRLWHGDAPGRACKTEFNPDEMWEIHLDPYGNIQTCCGIVVGSVRERPLREWLRDGFAANNELVRMVHDEGPYAYLELAKRHGYTPADGYAQKCHLCWETRKFLRPLYPETFGPAEVYETL